MLRNEQTFWLLTILVGLAAGAALQAQRDTKQPAPKFCPAGSYRVVRTNPDLNDKQEVTVYCDKDNGKAQAKANELNAPLPVSAKYYYAVRDPLDFDVPIGVPEPETRSSPPAKKPTPVVKLRVDPGPYKFMDGYNDPFGKKESNSLEGTTWEDKYVNQFYEFQKNGLVKRRSPGYPPVHPPWQDMGTYKLEGNAVTIDIGKGWIVYSGRIEGNTITGTISNRDRPGQSAKWEAVKK